MVDDGVIGRYRALVSALRAATGAAADADRRRNDVARQIYALSTQRDSLAALVFHFQADKEARAEQLAALDGQIAAARAEHDRVTSELSELQRRRDDASTLTCRCRDHLAENYGVARNILEF